MSALLFGANSQKDERGLATKKLGESTDFDPFALLDIGQRGSTSHSKHIFSDLYRALRTGAKP